jgi:hypothetical protein
MWATMRQTSGRGVDLTQFSNAKIASPKNKNAPLAQGTTTRF